MNTKYIENLYNVLSDYTDNIYIVLDAKQIIIEFNKKAERFFACKRNSAVGCKYTRWLVHSKLKPFLPSQNRLSKLVETRSQEVFIVDRNKKQKYLTLLAIPLLRNKKSEGIVLLGCDLTEQRIIEKKAKLEKKFLENIIAEMPGIVYWKDLHLKYLGCNDITAKTAGLNSREEIVGKVDIDLGWPIRKEDKEVLNSGKPKINIEEFISRSPNDRRLVYLLTNKVPLRDYNGKVIGVIGISTDITALKATQAALQEAKEKAELANQAKSNFLAIMSHELRTPMNAILGMAQILNSKNLSLEQKKYINVIMQSGKSLLILINDILNFSRLEAGKIEIRSELFHLCKLVNEVKNSMYHILEDKPIKLLVDYHFKDIDCLLGDPLRIRQLLVNLIGNAIKFTEQGYIKVKIKCIDRNPKEVKLKFTVEDTGIGIPKEKQQHIFERFTQVESNYSRRFGGVGLGLAICKQLTEAMGGRIGVRSQLGKGSNFWFELKFKLPIKKIKKSQEQKLVKIEWVNMPYAILLVEDNLLNQKVAKIMLEDLGCKVDIAHNGRESLDLFHKHKYDLIFMDVGLPDMDGLEITRRIRKLEKESHIPIVALTAHVLEEDKKSCFNAGADDVLVKPIIQDQLRNILVKWIGERKGLPSK